MVANEFEFCSNCGRAIPRSQQACVFERRIVCAECDKKLRKPLEHSKNSRQKAVTSTESTESEPRTKWLPCGKAKKAPIPIWIAIISAAVWIVLNVVSAASLAARGIGSPIGVLLLLAIGVLILSGLINRSRLAWQDRERSNVQTGR